MYLSKYQSNQLDTVEIHRMMFRQGVIVLDRRISEDIQTKNSHEILDEADLKLGIEKDILQRMNYAKEYKIVLKKEDNTIIIEKGCPCYFDASQKSMH